MIFNKNQERLFYEEGYVGVNKKEEKYEWNY